MPEFRFSEADSFEANWQAFLAELDGVDPDMASILRANKDNLAAIVRQGNRDTHARNDFNANVRAALDALLTPQSEEERS